MRFSLPASRQMALQCAMLLGLLHTALGQTGGDTNLLSSAGFGNKAADTPPAYSVSELFPHIEQVYGHSLAVEILTATDVGGIIGYGELEGGAAGGSDNDTILVNTVDDATGQPDMSEFEAAMVLAHEYEHSGRARASGGHGDPLTSDPLCGGCAHAEMHYDQIIAITVGTCEDPDGLYANDPGLYADVCNTMRANLVAAEHWDYNCGAAGCPTIGDWDGVRSMATTNLCYCCSCN